MSVYPSGGETAILLLGTIIVILAIPALRNLPYMRGLTRHKDESV